VAVLGNRWQLFVSVEQIMGGPFAGNYLASSTAKSNLLVEE
jgi:hypothetical protein